MLGIDPLRLADPGLAGDDVVPPEIAPGNHRTRTAGPLIDDHLPNRLTTAERDAFVDRGFQRQLFAAAALLVGRDHRHGARVVDPVAYRLCREAAEDDRMDRADARARLHRDDALDAHRHVDDDAVALPDALRAQSVGQLIDLGQQFPVGHLPDLAVVGLGDDRHLVAEAGLDIAIEAVVRSVQFAVGEPLVERRIRFIEDLRERLLPRHMLAGEPRPVARVVPACFFAQRPVGVHAGNRGLLDEFGRRLKKLNGIILGHRTSPVLCSIGACRIGASAPSWTSRIYPFATADRRQDIIATPDGSREPEIIKDAQTYTSLTPSPPAHETGNRLPSAMLSRSSTRMKTSFPLPTGITP